MVRKIKSRSPVVVVDADDFEVEIDGEMENPHDGEQVVFKKRVTPSDLMLVSRTADLQSVPEDERASFLARFFYDDVCPALARNIVSWTWTDMFADLDDDGMAPFVGDPTVDVLRSLDTTTEIQWLMSKWMGATQDSSEEEGQAEKNRPQPSSET